MAPSSALQTICAWCKQRIVTHPPLEDVAAEPSDAEIISHGICAHCANELTASLALLRPIPLHTTRLHPNGRIKITLKRA